MSSRRESSVGAARRGLDRVNRRHATRESDGLCVGCALSGALCTMEGNGKGTRLQAPTATRSPGADPARREPVRGGLATARRGGRVADRRAGATAHWDRRAYDGFCAGVSRSSYRSVCGPIHMQPGERSTFTSLPRSPCISRAPTPHKTQLTCPPSRSATSEPSRTTSHATHREWPYGVHAPTPSRAHTCVHALGRPPRPTQPRT